MSDQTTTLRNNFTVTGDVDVDGRLRVRGVDIPVTNQKIVQTAADLSGELSSDIVYIIDGEVDMGNQSITVPQGGLSINGLGFGVSKLFSTEDGFTLFVDDGTYAGDLFITSTDIQITGTGSRVWDLENSENLNAVECITVNFLDCDCLGPLSNYRQGLFENVALINCVDGLEMVGTWAGGFRATVAIIVQAGPSPTFTGTMFKAGAGLTIGGRFITDFNAEDLADSGTFCDFSPSNILIGGRFQVNGLSVNENANSFPNMPEGDPKARFSNCDGTANTYVGGQWSVTSEVATNIAAANTPVKLAGVTTYTDMQWFAQTTDNAFVYAGRQEIGTKMLITLSLDGEGGGGDEINVIARHWVDSISDYIDLAESGPVTMDAGDRIENISFHAFCTFNTNDRFEVWVENQSDTSNVTAKLGGIVSIEERAS